MEIEIRKFWKFAFLERHLFEVSKYSELGWAYRTLDSKCAKLFGFKKYDNVWSDYYLLPIKDIAHTRGFYSTVFCVYKGYKCQFMSSTFNEENQTFCMRLSPDLALAKGYNWNQIGHEIQLRCRPNKADIQRRQMANRTRREWRVRYLISVYACE